MVENIASLVVVVVAVALEDIVVVIGSDASKIEFAIHVNQVCIIIIVRLRKCLQYLILKAYQDSLWFYISLPFCLVPHIFDDDSHYFRLLS